MTGSERPTATYFWHDYETFGSDPRRDKPAQFAGIRTDEDFNIIGEPLVRYCQPPAEMLGHPEATLVTGITPQYAMQNGVPESQFIADIEAEMATPGTCSVGYNNLQFDDEVTRHALWRNFFDPYAREWQNQCSRWDIIDMARLAYALRPDGIEWPTRDDGAPSFKLEDLAVANNLGRGSAHDALSDVYATIDLARLIRAKQPRLFDFVRSNRDKKTARKLLNMDTRKPTLHVSSKFGASNGCLSPVMPIAPHPTNRNCLIVYDLRVDPEPLLTLDAESIRERMFTPRKDLPEDAPRVALKGVYLNKCPVLAPFEMLRPPEAERLAIDVDMCRAYWKAIHDNMAAVATKATEVFDRGPGLEPAADPEHGLYDGLIGDADRERAAQVRAGSTKFFSNNQLVFDDDRLNTLFFRYRARYYPESLSLEEDRQWREWQANELAYAPSGGLTLDEYDEIVAALMSRVRGQPKQLQRLLDLKAWADQRRALVSELV